MKCVELQNGRIVRVSNTEAFNLTARGNLYAPKSAYKAQERGK